tara:strand:+ start:86 stop:259 length:174 start_codon:yes stop_codon:yes gene_type:complete
MNIEQIKKLVEKFPNDQELGEAIRTLYWMERKKSSANPNQMNLFDEGTRDDAILGYD